MQRQYQSMRMVVYLWLKYGQTERKSVIKAKEILKKANANIIGVFLNKTK